MYKAKKKSSKKNKTMKIKMINGGAVNEDRFNKLVDALILDIEQKGMKQSERDRYAKIISSAAKENKELKIPKELEQIIKEALDRGAATKLQKTFKRQQTMKLDKENSKQKAVKRLQKAVRESITRKNRSKPPSTEPKNTTYENILEEWKNSVNNDLNNNEEGLNIILNSIKESYINFDNAVTNNKESIQIIDHQLVTDDGTIDTWNINQKNRLNRFNAEEINKEKEICI